jgi:general secretion pathway protein K
MSPEKLQEMLAQRADPNADPRSLLSIAGGEGAVLTGSKAYRISLGVEFGSVSRNAAEVVILLLDSGEAPYRVLSWRNVSDGATAPQRAR